MALKELYIGPRGYEVFVPAPVMGGDFSSIGWGGGMQFINGGYGVRTSKTTHKEYNMSWSLNKRDELRPITDMYDGVYGPGLIHFIDPFAADKNVLPQSWAFPALAAYDAIPIIGDERPDLVNTPVNNLGYPVESALYKFPGTSQRLYIPIPTGYVAWVGQHGSVTGTGGLRVTTVLRGNVAGGTVAVPMLSVGSLTRVSTSFSGVAGIELWYIADNSTNIVLSGAMVQILPAGVTPDTGGFISGQGNSGCAFDKAPATTAYSAAIDKIGLSAKLIEVGSWL